MGNKAKSIPARADALTAERLRELLSYDPETGQFRWLVSRRGARKGALAGYRKNTSGYVNIHVDGVLYGAHRLAWLYVHGKWPTDQIDHINGWKNQNAIANLRECTAAENSQNLRKYRNNTTGLTGTTRSGKKFMALISVKSKSVYLGTYDSVEKAHAAYLAAKAIYHPFNPSVRAA